MGDEGSPLFAKDWEDYNKRMDGKEEKIVTALNSIMIVKLLFDIRDKINKK